MAFYRMTGSAGDRKVRRPGPRRSVEWIVARFAWVVLIFAVVAAPRFAVRAAAEEAGANRVPIEIIRFERGASSKDITGAVIRGERSLYSRRPLRPTPERQHLGDRGQRCVPDLCAGRASRSSRLWRGDCWSQSAARRRGRRGRQKLERHSARYRHLSGGGRTYLRKCDVYVEGLDLLSVSLSVRLLGRSQVRALPSRQGAPPCKTRLNPRGEAPRQGEPARGGRALVCEPLGAEARPPGRCCEANAVTMGMNTQTRRG